jgi:hypothetical protein
MPFTAAHPAIVLPLLGRLRVPYATSALVIGAMAPDFEYFIRLRPLATISHTFAGLFFFCLPVGLLVLIVFHRVIKRPATLLLPDWLRLRLPAAIAERRVRPGDAGAIAVLLVFGAATHLAWDSFTHSDGWVVTRWPALSARVATVLGADIRVYKLLQHGSTLIGLMAIVLVVAAWLRRQPVGVATDRALSPSVRWAAVAGILLASVAAGALWAASGDRAIQISLGRFVVATITAFAAAVLMFSLIARRALRGTRTS